MGVDCDEAYLAQARWAASRMGLEGVVDFRRLQVYDLFRVPGRWDLLLFMGVLYHLRYPLLALDILHERTGRLLLFQCLTMPGEEVAAETDGFGFDRRDVLLQPGWPKAAFIEHRFQGDPTNWWIPNHAAAEAMLRSAGFEILSRPAHEIYFARPDAEHPPCTAGWNREELLAACGALPLPAEWSATREG